MIFADGLTVWDLQHRAQYRAYIVPQYVAYGCNGCGIKAAYGLAPVYIYIYIHLYIHTYTFFVSSPPPRKSNL
jgi:hypothetical protein